MRDFRSELYRVAKMAKSSLDELPEAKHPEMFLTNVIPFTKTVSGKFHDINGFSFSLSFLLAYYGIEKKGVVYFLDGFSEYWCSKGITQERRPLLLKGMYGFDEYFRREDFYREYPNLIRKYLNHKDPIAAFQADVLEFNHKIFTELSSSDAGNFRPTGIFGLDYSFTVEYGKEQVPAIGRLPLVNRRNMIWI